MADRCVAPVLSGEKRATTSSRERCRTEGAAQPQVGRWEPIPDGAGRAHCVVRVAGVQLVRFGDVDAASACEKGEGTRSLRHWRRVHHAFFAAEAAVSGCAFGEDSEVVPERSRRVANAGAGG